MRVREGAGREANPVRTRDLDQPWETIEDDLLAILEPAPGAISLSAVP
jgi:hypothetical protein